MTPTQPTAPEKPMVDTKAVRAAWEFPEFETHQAVHAFCDEIDALRQRVFDLEKGRGQLLGRIHDLEYALLRARGQGRMK